ncbi:MAG TPA: hypothetical protein VFM12_08875 [Gemmatimonadales bacterium]|nr:hypothetical protein [Gemmatimonadales bacterium]
MTDRISHGVYFEAAAVIVSQTLLEQLLELKARSLTSAAIKVRGATQGVLFRDAAAIENLRKVDTLIVDKTGTLTEGRPRFDRVVAAHGVEEDAVLRLAASLDQGSEHPRGRHRLGRPWAVAGTRGAGRLRLRVGHRRARHGRRPVARPGQHGPDAATGRRRCARGGAGGGTAAGRAAAWWQWPATASTTHRRSRGRTSASRWAPAPTWP